jgi:hypothetical protein
MSTFIPLTLEQTQIVDTWNTIDGPVIDAPLIQTSCQPVGCAFDNDNHHPTTSTATNFN